MAGTAGLVGTVRGMADLLAFWRRDSAGGAATIARDIGSRVARAKPTGRIIGCLILAGFVAIRIWDPIPVQMLRQQVFDLFQLWSPRAVTSGEVVIVDIDDASLSVIGQWPWPRTTLARLVDRLSEAGVASIGFDSIFAEPDRTSPRRLAAELSGINNHLRMVLGRIPDNEQAFAASMKKSRVTLGQSLIEREEAQGTTEPVDKTSVAVLGMDPAPFLKSGTHLLRNLPELEAAASGIGLVTFDPEVDGVVRRVPLVTNVEGTILPSLALEVLRVASDESTVIVKADEYGVDSIIAGGREIPTDRHGQVWVYYTPSDLMRYVSAKDVLFRSVDAEQLEGTMVLVGTSAVGLHDIKRTPLSPATPGVEIHAQLLDTVLTDSFIRRPAGAVGAELVILVLSSLVVVMLGPSLGAFATLYVGFALTAVLWLGAFYLFAEHAYLLDLSWTAIASFATYVLVIYIKYVTEESARKSVRNAFSRYLEPAVVDSLADHPEQLRLGGEIRTMTMMFSDVRGFTSIAEKYEAEELTALINRILTPLTEVILAEGGTVDKYMGDCVMAFWNAPLDTADHEIRACRAALGMLDAIGKLNAEIGEEARASGIEAPRIAIGVGINTGEACVGNLGSDYRFDYSVLGDAVNLASRLEGQSKFYGCGAIIGEQTAAKAGDFALLELDLIRVKGKDEPARIFGLLGGEELGADPAFRGLVAANAALLDAYRAGAWSKAREALERCRANPQSALAEELYSIYDERIADLAVQPADPAWDGVYVAQRK